MHLNLLHRPALGDYQKIFELQQDLAHQLDLKVTLLIQLNHMHDAGIVELVKAYEKKYGDEIGIWFENMRDDTFVEGLEARESYLWLFPEKDKRKIIKSVIDKFRESFQREPVSVGAYHLDAVSLRIIKEICPEVQIAVAGCFEEGVKVFHGCNNSWYLFNEGMPWGPWHPSLTNSLRPAETEDEAIDIVAVPHLSRDLALSYEGRNDYWASHPANVQRGMGNEGAVSPYNLNLVDQYRMQEDLNDGLSFYHVFVGAYWLSNCFNIQDSDEITQGLYRELLEYFVELRNQGKLIDMHMSEFAVWFKQNVPVGKPQVYLAKEMLYGSGKHYFWYIDPQMRVLVDTAQGGSIGDFRPFVGKQARHTGSDSPCLIYGSNPYLIHSQYRSGISHHFTDGSRTTLLVKHGGETIDLGTCRTRVADVIRDEAGTHLKLEPANLKFKNGLSVSIETSYDFLGNGKIIIERSISDISDQNAELELTEYFKGCYGVTEYPENMRGISLAVDGDVNKSIDYDYQGRELETTNARSVSAVVPQANTVINMAMPDVNGASGKVIEGYLFNPYYTLTLSAEIKAGKGLKTYLWITKNK
jgi:hypothetical protein